MNHSFIRTYTEGEIFFITLTRPQTGNALTLDMLEGVACAARITDEYPAVRAIIVQAEGPIFSAGLDLITLMQSRAQSGDQNVGRWLRRTAARMQHALNVIESTELPVIGVLNGQVVGLGMELALAFDFRIAVEDCLLSIPDVRLGMIANGGGTARLSRLVGTSRAKDMLMTGRAVSAAEALQWGLVNRVVPTEAEALQTARDLAAQITANAPLAVGMAKLLVDQGRGLEPHIQMAIERWAQSQLIDTDDAGEAMTAFIEKRSPVFHGR